MAGIEEIDVFRRAGIVEKSYGFADRVALRREFHRRAARPTLLAFEVERDFLAVVRGEHSADLLDLRRCAGIHHGRIDDHAPSS